MLGSTCVINPMMRRKPRHSVKNVLVSSVNSGKTRALGPHIPFSLLLFLADFGDRGKST